MPLQGQGASDAAGNYVVYGRSYFGPPPEFRQSVTSHAAITDSAAIGSGTYVLSFEQNVDHIESVTNNTMNMAPPGAGFVVGSISSAYGTYSLADDGSGPVSNGATVLVESYSYTLSQTGNGSIGVVLTGTAGFTGFGFTAVATLPAPPSITASPGTTLSVQSSQSSGVTTVTVTATTPVGALPLMPGGVPTRIGGGIQLNTQLNGGTGGGAEQKIISHYYAQFQ